MKKILLSILLSLSAFVVGARSKPIEVLVISGQTGNGHNGQIMSQSLKSIYAGCEVFRADMLFVGGGGVAFDPQFSEYDVVVLCINNMSWSDEIKSRFEEYVSNGGGVVIIHEANNAFPEWKEYNRMIALGGWGNRDERWGPYYYWRDGEFVKDYSAGKGGHHGRKVPYDINVRSVKHPILKGLPQQWRHYGDELYGLLRGPAENLEVLATAYSDKKSRGTGREEPVLMTISYGKGRIFHTVLGHTAKDYTTAVENIGYQVTLLRGSEWAATGRVKRCSRLTFEPESRR